ncbi:MULTISPECIES: hypothetical protein [unclassified Pseudomonas]|uniref:hypothetical protein n=1 Tax=unclassified Pseudomonas TaxID=196821 RepID=UPI0039B74CFC
MSAKNTASMVPSMANELLRNTNGRRVDKLVRYSWWAASEVSVNCGIQDEMAFSLTAGPLVIYFEDGIVLGFSSDPSLNSVIVWDEAARSSAESHSLESDDDLFAIFVAGRFATVFWEEIVGDYVSDLTILKHREMSAKERQCPSEVGLRFRFSSGKSFVVSHGLHDNSDDFSVLEESQIKVDDLEEIPVNQR